MSIGTYLLIAFIVLFFTYKLKYPKFKQEFNDNYYTTLWVECPTFWVIVIIPITWIISLPLILLWKILDKLTKNLFKH